MNDLSDGGDKEGISTLGLNGPSDPEQGSPTAFPLNEAPPSLPSEFEVSEAGISKNVIVEFRLGKQPVHGIMRAIEVVVGQRIRDLSIRVEVPSGHVFEMAFRTVRVIGLPNLDPRALKMWNSGLFRRVKVHEKNYERIQQFFGGVPASDSDPNAVGYKTYMSTSLQRGSPPP